MMMILRGRSSDATKSGLVEQGLRLGEGAVVDGDDVAVPREVAGEVAPHHGQPRDADLGSLAHGVLLVLFMT
jgi:hypothetical protein